MHLFLAVAAGMVAVLETLQSKMAGFGHFFQNVA